MRFCLITASLLALLVAAPSHAGHANPWATPEDDVLMQYHDENLLQSVDTVGEDEMLGVMEQQAVGKLSDSEPGQLDDAASAGSAESAGGAGSGDGAGGNGGAGGSSGSGGSGGRS